MEREQGRRGRPAGTGARAARTCLPVISSTPLFMLYSSSLARLARAPKNCARETPCGGRAGWAGGQGASAAHRRLAGNPPLCDHNAPGTRGTSIHGSTPAPSPTVAHHTTHTRAHTHTHTRHRLPPACPCPGAWPTRSRRCRSRIQTWSASCRLTRTGWRRCLWRPWRRTWGAVQAASRRAVRCAVVR